MHTGRYIIWPKEALSHKLEIELSGKESPYALTLKVSNKKSSCEVRGTVETANNRILMTDTKIVHGRELFHKLVEAIREING